MHTGPAAAVASESLLEFVEASGGLDPVESAHGHAFFLLSASSSLLPAWSPLDEVYSAPPFGSTCAEVLNQQGFSRYSDHLLRCQADSTTLTRSC